MGKHSSDVVASPDRRVKCVRSLSAVAPAPACSEDNKLEKANQIIVELGTRNASQSAMGARTAALNNHGRLLQTLRIPAGALDSSFPVAEVFLKFSGSATELDIQGHAANQRFGKELSRLARKHGGAEER